VGCGTWEAVQQRRAACGWPSHTAGVKRLPLTIRQPVAAIGRRVSPLCTGEEGLEQQRVLYHGYDNGCLPHGSVRPPLPQPVPTHGTGSAKPWRPSPPARAAGVTDHVWVLKEVRLYRVPPGPQTVSKLAWVDDRIVEGLRVLRGKSRGVDRVLNTGCE
jgi:hypothetical protein